VASFTMKQALLFSSSVQGDGKRRRDGIQYDNAISALHRKRPSANSGANVEMGQEETHALQQNRGGFESAGQARGSSSSVLASFRSSVSKLSVNQP